MRACKSGVRKSGATTDSLEEDPNGGKSGESCEENGDQHTSDTRVTFQVTPIPSRVRTNTPVVRRGDQATPSLNLTKLKSPINFSREEAKTRKQTTFIPSKNSIDV